MTLRMDSRMNLLQISISERDADNDHCRKVVRRGWALFALPTVLCFAVFFVVPLAMGIYLSFTSFRTVTDAKWVG